MPIANQVSRYLRPLASVASAAVFLVAVLLLAGCGSSGSSSSGSSSGSSSSSSSSSESGEPIKVGLVTDVGGLNDRSYNSLANKGVEEAEEQLGAEGRVLVSKANSDYVPNLASLAQQGDDLVIGVGFLMAEAVETVAAQFPETNFAIIDVEQPTMKTKPANVLGLVFKSEQAGYLAGYLAGEYSKAHQITTISSVGGEKIPQVDTWLAGYAAGAKAADPSIEVLNDYSQTFVDQSKCKEIALSQISRGSKIVFQAAGGCGLGALDAAKTQGVLAIGVDADQRYIGEFILTSAVKKVDAAVLATAKEVQEGTFKAGGDKTFDLSNNGVGLGSVAPYGKQFVPKVNTIATEIKDGKINVPTTVE